MEKLRTNFASGQPFLAEHINATNAAVNELIDAAFTSKTYAQMVALISQNALVPGSVYRITDFVTTAVDERDDVLFRSAGHPFDIIVRALTNNTLEEKAAAIQHAGDTYFADCNLAAWQIWYDINNDTTKYNWADATNGKGVIWRMIDEHNNDCPYDFKNIQFKRWAITEITSTSLTEDALSSLQEVLVYDDNGNRHMANKDIYGNWIPQDVQGTEYTIDETNFGWYYTFDGISSEDGETPGAHYDMSAHPFRLSDECIQAQLDDDCGVDYADYCKNNIIKSAYYEYVVDDQYYKGRQVLNNIVFANSMSYCYYDEEGEYWNYTTNYCYNNTFGNYCQYNTFGNDCGGNTFGNYCQYNTFGNNCYNNTFGNGCGNNTFGNGCGNNTFGNDCGGNTFGNNCYNNTFGNYCQYNTFGNGCGNNTFGNNCYNNTFGNGCGNNTFGNNCYNNTFGNYCQYNTFGNNCKYNTFGNNCYNNTFGNNCYNNTFGNYCQYNTFGNYCQYNTFGNDYMRCCSFGDGVQYCSISNYSTGSSNYLQYIIVLNGTQGSDSSNLLALSGLSVGVSYSQTCGLNSSGTYTHKNVLD